MFAMLNRSIMYIFFYSLPAYLADLVFLSDLSFEEGMGEDLHWHLKAIWVINSPGSVHLSLHISAQQYLFFDVADTPFPLAAQGRLIFKLNSSPAPSNLWASRRQTLVACIIWRLCRRREGGWYIGLQPLLAGTKASSWSINEWHGKSLWYLITFNVQI